LAVIGDKLGSDKNVYWLSQHTHIGEPGYQGHKQASLVCNSSGSIILLSKNYCETGRY